MPEEITNTASKRLSKVLSEVVPVPGAALALIVEVYALYEIIRATVEVKPTLIAGKVFDPFTAHFFPLAIIVAVVLGAVGIGFARHHPPKLFRLRRILQVAIALVTLAFVGHAVWGWQGPEDSDQLVVVVNIKSDQEATGSDARAFFERIRAEIESIDSRTDEDLKLNIWATRTPRDYGDDEEALSNIQENANIGTVLWINYTDHDVTGTDELYFLDYAAEFEPWSQAYLPMLPSVIFDSNTLPRKGSWEELAAQTLAAVHMQIATICYSEGNPRAAWKVLADVWNRPSTEEQPELAHLKRDPTYFYLLALLTGWAENNPVSDSSVSSLKLARAQLGEGRDFLSRKLDPPEEPSDAYYRLYLLQVNYALRNVAGMERMLESESYGACDAGLSGEHISDEDRTRLTARMKLIARIWLDFSQLIEHPVEDKVQDLVGKLLICEDSAETNLLAVRMYTDLILDAKNEQISGYLYRALYEDLAGEARNRARLFWSCQEERIACPAELDEVAEWVGTWDAGDEVRVFRFGHEWEDYAQATIPTGSQVLTATRKSNSILRVNILDASLETRGEYEYDGALVCGSRLVVKQIPRGHADSDQGLLGFDVPLGDIIAKDFEKTFIYANKDLREFSALCKLRLKIHHGSGFNETTKSVAIWVIGRPVARVEITETGDSVEAYVDIGVSWGPYGMERVFRYYNNFAEGAENIQVEACIMQDEEKCECHTVPWQYDDHAVVSFARPTGMKYSVRARVLYNGSVALEAEGRPPR